ncbi:MAG: flavodoxin family protein [Lachnospiraceae bacterium]|nr:flavodoxin family protein [Lachnospiraceae bacterium]
MILVVNTTTDTSVSEEVKRLATEGNKDIKLIEAGNKKIGNCIGCNYCWLKTPGECTVKDDYEEIFKEIIHAKELWVISDTALGFINHKGKNFFDRILPIATMYLKFKGKEMRHVARYKSSPDVGIIYSGEADKAYLNRWTERCAINFESKSLGAYSTENIKEAVACM